MVNNKIKKLKNKKKTKKNKKPSGFFLSVPAGIEPATFRLTAERSKPTELWDQ